MAASELCRGEASLWVARVRGEMMTARAIILVIAIALGMLAGPLVTEAQPAAPRYRIGVLLTMAPGTAVVPHVEALRERLRELGYVEGKNLTLDLRWMSGAEGGLDRAAADLARSKVDLLIAWTTPATLAAKRATSTIPIVMVSVGDPVGSELVTSLARPGGNLTGVSNVSRDLSAKLLQLLKEVRPDLTRVAVLRNASNPGRR